MSLSIFTFLMDIIFFMLRRVVSGTFLILLLMHDILILDKFYPIYEVSESVGYVWFSDKKIRFWQDTWYVVLVVTSHIFDCYLYNCTACLFWGYVNVQLVVNCHYLTNTKGMKPQHCDDIRGWLDLMNMVMILPTMIWIPLKNVIFPLFCCETALTVIILYLSSPTFFEIYFLGPDPQGESFTCFSGKSNWTFIKVISFSIPGQCSTICYAHDSYGQWWRHILQRFGHNPFDNVFEWLQKLIR